jgi:TatD DNase family protein
MYFIDTHAHLYKEYFPVNFKETVQRAVDANVKKIILPCVKASNVSELLDAADQFPNHLYPLIGLHPTDVNTESYEAEIEVLEKYLSDERVAGIGECGLDLYWDKTHLEAQKIVIKKHLEWAKTYHYPLSFHVRDAYAEMIQLLEKYGKGIKGVMHCFSGGIQEAKWAVKQGFYLGIGGIITFKNNKLQHIIKETGLSHLVLETDAPFLAPVPYRGKTNESAYIPLIAEKIAEIFDTSIDTVMEVTTQNSLELFPKLM